MLVKFIRPWKWFCRGQVAEIATGRAQVLCSNGLAEAAVVETPSEKPTAIVKKKTRRRRKKSE